MATASTDLIPPIERNAPPRAGDEREMLTTYLDWHRDTLQSKCADLTAEHLTDASCPPSNLTLLGLIRHLADVERNWFTRGSGQEAPPIYYTDEDPEADFEFETPVSDAEVRETFQTWRAECDRSRAIVSSVDLDGALKDGETTWRWVLHHMIEEYARHNGHADLLREAIDGATGI